ncbi:MAG TPA: creatininase family protein [Verrucomicrobiae bacterium]|nr:creatininase family protein [Verrucomicrobiae bacterium]
MQLAELSWPAVEALSKDTPVVFPIAALEQHGHHLPVFTDSMLLGEIVRRAAEHLKDQVLFAPLMWLGNSDHHIDFAGTLSASPRTYLELIGGLANDFIRYGFKRIVFVNGHGGNEVPGRQALFEVRQQHRERNDLLLLLATYWNFGGKVDETFHQKEMAHACEWETSMIMRLAPHLVGNYKKAEPVEPGTGFGPGFRAWTTRDRTRPGHIGWPHLATAEKGETLFRAFSEGLIGFLERVVRWDGRSWNG